MLALYFQGALDSLPDSVRCCSWPTGIALFRIPPLQNVRRDMWKKGRNRITSSSCTACRSPGVGCSVSWRMVPSFVLFPFSFLICTTLVPMYSQSCESFFGKVSRVVLDFVLMAVFPRTELLFAPPHCVCWAQHLALGHYLTDRFSFFAVNMGSCSRDLAVTPLVKVPYRALWILRTKLDFLESHWFSTQNSILE